MNRFGPLSPWERVRVRALDRETLHLLNSALRLSSPPPIRLKRITRFHTGLLICLAIAILWSIATPASAQRTEPLPKELEGVGVTEHLGEQIPLDLPFVDSDGKPVVLKQFFDGKRPVVLTMNYSNCPMLCSLQINGLFNGRDGEDDRGTSATSIEVVTVSIDPLEIPERARADEAKVPATVWPARRAQPRGGTSLPGKEARISRSWPTAVGFRLRATFPRRLRQYCASWRSLMILHARRPRVALPRTASSMIRKRCGWRCWRPAEGKDRLGDGPGAAWPVSTTMPRAQRYGPARPLSADASSCGLAHGGLVLGGAILSVYWLAAKRPSRGRRTIAAQGRRP